MKNLCGKCNVCCEKYRLDKKFLSWRDTDKPADELCDKYKNGGCVRYKNRPKPCKDFECLYLMLSKSNSQKLEWRPDKVCVVVRAGTADGHRVVIVEEIESKSIDFSKLTPEQDSLLQKANEICRKNDFILLFRPFGHDKQYQLRVK